MILLSKEHRETPKDQKSLVTSVFFAQEYNDSRSPL
jgi:hypothetical protein